MDFGFEFVFKTVPFRGKSLVGDIFENGTNRKKDGFEFFLTVIVDDFVFSDGTEPAEFGRLMLEIRIRGEGGKKDVIN